MPSTGAGTPPIPNLGFDDFISLEDMHGVDKVRDYYWAGGLVTDASMGQQIIQEYEALKAQSDAPVFLHAVTMQNHNQLQTRPTIPDEQRVHITSAPRLGCPRAPSALWRTSPPVSGMPTRCWDSWSAVTFSQVWKNPVILVFWGDHYNPIDSGYDVYTATGYASANSADPALHQTTPADVVQLQQHPGGPGHHCSL